MTILKELLVHGTAILLHVSGDAACAIEALDEKQFVVDRRVLRRGREYRLVELFDKRTYKYTKGMIKTWCRDYE